MATLNSDNLGLENSPERLFNKILTRNNVCAQKSLYDFESVECSFNIKILGKPPNNNQSKPPDLVENLINLSAKTKRSYKSQTTMNVASTDPVVEIMLPKRHKSLVTRDLKKNAISEPKEMALTPIQLFQYKRFNRNINNFSTPKGPKKPPVFTCSTSESRNKTIPSSVENSPIKIVNGSKTGYCCFHNQTGQSSNQKTITKSKYMSLASVISRKECETFCDSSKSEGTMAMSVSNAETELSNSVLSDVSSSSGKSNEIPNINDETSSYLSRILTNSNKQSYVEMVPQASDSSSEDSNGNTMNHVDIQQNLGNNGKLANISTGQDQITITEGVVLQPPFNYNTEHNSLSIESDSNSDVSGEFNKLNLTVSESDREEVTQMDIIIDKRNEPTVPNESIQQNQISTIVEIESVVQPSFNDNVELNKLSEESEIQIIKAESPENKQTLMENLTSEQNSTSSFMKGMRQSARLKNRASAEQQKSSKAKRIITNKRCPPTGNSILPLNKLVADTSNNKSLSSFTEELVTTIDVNKESPRLPSQTRIDVIHPTEIRLNCPKFPTKLNSNTICTKAVRQSARIKERACHKSNSVISTKTGQNSFKEKRKVRNRLKVIHQPSNIIQQNTLSLTNNNITDPSNNSQSSFTEESEYVMNVDAENPGLLNAPEVQLNNNSESNQSLSSKPNSVITTIKSKRKPSRIKAIAKSNLEPIDQMSNNTNANVHRDSLPREEEPLTSENIIAPRRSSRTPKPKYAYWLNGPRRIIPVIRDINQLADNYDSRIPIILLPPKVLGDKELGQLLHQINNRMLNKARYMRN